MPVVMVSSLTAQGAAVTLTALKLGAVDFVEKPSGTVSIGLDLLREQIVRTVRAAACIKVRRSQGLGRRIEQARVARPVAPRSTPRPSPEMPVVLIGSSTGGPGVVEALLAAMPPDLPAAIVAEDGEL